MRVSVADTYQNMRRVLDRIQGALVHHYPEMLIADIIVDGYIVSAACVFLCRSQIENPSVGDVLGALSLADKTLDHDDNITQHLLILAEDMLGQDSFLMKKEIELLISMEWRTHVSFSCFEAFWASLRVDVGCIDPRFLPSASVLREPFVPSAEWEDDAPVSQSTAADEWEVCDSSMESDSTTLLSPSWSPPTTRASKGSLASTFPSPPEDQVQTPFGASPPPNHSGTRYTRAAAAAKAHDVDNDDDDASSESSRWTPQSAPSDASPSPEPVRQGRRVSTPKSRTSSWRCRKASSPEWVPPSSRRKANSPNQAGLKSSSQRIVRRGSVSRTRYTSSPHRVKTDGSDSSGRRRRFGMGSRKPTTKQPSKAPQKRQSLVARTTQFFRGRNLRISAARDILDMC